VRPLLLLLSAAIAFSTATCRKVPKATPHAASESRGDPSNDVALPGSKELEGRPRLEFIHRVLGGAADEALPWIVAFHGLGDSPENFAYVFDRLQLRAHVYLPRAPITYGDGYDWFGARVAEHDKLTHGIEARLPEVTELIDALAARPSNVGDAIVTGFSQGGILSFAVASAGLRHVKAALPIAGWLPPALASAPKRLSVIAFHGEADAVVPFEATRTLVDSWLNQTDPQTVQLHTYPGVRHTIAPAMYRDWSKALEQALSPLSPPAHL
jgi:phospholipase/carboxylesterase